MFATTGTLLWGLDRTVPCLIRKEGERMITKKEFLLIAEQLHSERPDACGSYDRMVHIEVEAQERTWDNIVSTLAYTFKDHKNFDKAEFIDVCHGRNT